MSSTKFIAILPQTLQSGDKIRIKGTITDNAEQFSINFVNDTCKTAENITYHFKWILHDDIIVENYKQNGEWIDHRETEYNAFDGRLTNDIETFEKSNENSYSNTNGFNTAALKIENNAFNNPPYSILGPTFGLEFAFQEDDIYVYLIHDEGRNIITRYEPEYEISDIESIQVWGDIKKINELTFSYN